jgi:hypothetical protein
MKINKGMSAKLLPILLLLVFCAPTYAAPLVFNGTFDTDSGWDFVDTDTPHWADSSGNPGGFAILNNYPAGRPSISQAIVGLQLGAQYNLTWDMKNQYNCCGSAEKPGAGVSIDGKSWEYIDYPGMPWTSYSVTFTYEGGSNILEFTSQLNDTDSDAGIDNVVLEKISVPEPSFLVLLGCGLAAVA